MKPLQFIIIIVVIVLAWASLFITSLDQSAKTNQLVTTLNTSLANETTIIKQQKQTIDVLSGKISDLGSHVDCLFNLAEQPNHSSSYIANASSCIITTTTPGTTPKPVSAAPNASSQPSKVFVSSPQSQSAPNSGNTQTNNSPKPVKSTICKLTLGVFGC